MLIYLYSGTSTNNNKQQHCSAVSIANRSGLSKIIEKTSNKMCRQNRDRFGGGLRIRHLRFILASWNKTRRRTRAWILIENKMSGWWGGAVIVSSFSPLYECPAIWVSYSCSLRRIGCQSAVSLVAVQVQDSVKQLIIYCFYLFICRYSNNSQQVKLSSMMWKIWPCLPDYGRRAAQFVDLLGYFTIKCESNTDEVLTSVLWINLVLNWSAWGQASPIQPLYWAEHTDNL